VEGKSGKGAAACLVFENLLQVGCVTGSLAERGSKRGKKIRQVSVAKASFKELWLAVK